MSVQTEATEYAVLTTEQREFFENNGYLVIKNALPPEVVAEIDAAIDEVHEREPKAGRLEAEGKLNMRNCITQHDAFFQLLDWPKTAPLAWDILNWNIQMITSHLIVLPSKPEPPPEIRNKIGLHRDGGTSPGEMQEPHPRILLKIAYAISDQSDPASGATVLVPGSNRLMGKLAVDTETGWARGAISMNVKAGDAFIFEQRTWHGVGHNWSGKPRKTIFMGYAYRWVKPMDYIAMPEELIAKCTTPIQKQLLGVVSDPLSYYLPKDEDVPLKAVVNQN
ncbi:MAG: phytanoyl-CoA dioxygenase family protein [Candidatus Poribacteria bacterium]|nr:phytanoyl-CoA dioxygenase family protein [Candidatus Poribacteria bacterium]